jgi:hypothetical protein
MKILKIVSVKDDFFIENDLRNIESELIPNIENGHNRPYVIVIKLNFKGNEQDFAIPFRSNIAGYRDKSEYFALPPRKETKPRNIHGLHFIKMFPINKDYFIRYNYPTDNASATLTKNFIEKNFTKLIDEAQNYIDKYEEGYRPQFCVDIGKLYNKIHKIEQSSSTQNKEELIEV